MKTNYDLIKDTMEDLKMSVSSLNFIIKDLNNIKDDDLLDILIEFNHLNRDAKHLYAFIHRIISKGQ